MKQKEIVQEWEAIAELWTQAIREEKIPSRKVTNQALLECIKESSPQSVLDLGCGEGWLLRTMADSKVECFGIDSSLELVERCIDTGCQALQIEYSDLSNSLHQLPRKFECMVSNFSILGKSDLIEIVNSAPRLLVPQGLFILQTLHPVEIQKDLPYLDQWRSTQWKGVLKELEARPPSPWFFKTLSGWVADLSTQFDLVRIVEPCCPEKQRPLSIIFITRLR